MNDTIDLSKSYHDGVRKSCPNCSRKAGRVVYLEPSSFGMRIDDKTGHELMQSWCNDCRSKAAHTEPTP